LRKFHMVVGLFSAYICTLSFFVYSSPSCVATHMVQAPNRFYQFEN
jgi:hypothetical protein